MSKTLKTMSFGRDEQGRYVRLHYEDGTSDKMSGETRHSLSVPLTWHAFGRSGAVGVAVNPETGEVTTVRAVHHKPTCPNPPYWEVEGRGSMGTRPRTTVVTVSYACLAELHNSGRLAGGMFVPGCPVMNDDAVAGTVDATSRPMSRWH